MPPDLGRAYAPDWLGLPPHMAATDLPLWQRARGQLAGPIVVWYFDAAVGEGQVMPEDIPEEMRAGIWRTSRLRIDAVGRARDHWLLIEVRPNAGLGALGHITSYRALWERDPPDTLPVRAVLVSDRLQSDVGRTALNANIRLLVV